MLRAICGLSAFYSPEKMLMNATLTGLDQPGFGCVPELAGRTRTGDAAGPHMAVWSHDGSGPRQGVLRPAFSIAPRALSVANCASVRR